jgi:hypothetical protein
MGTFHDGLGELHGITVVVETNGSRTAVGRCHELNEAGIVLLDADVHDARDGGVCKAAFLEKAARFGVWARAPKLVLPRAEIASVRPLGEVARELESGT